MQENWRVFMRDMEKCPTFITINLGIQDQVPLISKEKLFIVILDLLKPRYNGLPTKEEHEKLGVIEDQLNNQLKNHFNIVQVGRFSGVGVREFYYYTNASKDELYDCTNQILKLFPKYKYKLKYGTDSEWKFYRKDIFPTGLELNRATDQDVVLMLRSRGDSLKYPRIVEHYSYFERTDYRDVFKDKILNLGFTVINEYEVTNDESKYKYAVSFKRLDKVELDSINKITSELYLISKDLNGEYGGWETKIVERKGVFNYLKSLFKKS